MRANRDVLGSVVAVSVISIFVFVGTREIYRSAIHSGPGMVAHETGAEWESESEYRTDGYIGGGLILVVGVVLGVSWFNFSRRSNATA